MAKIQNKAVKVRYTTGEQVLHAVIVVLCTLLSLGVLLPILNILFGAFSDPYEVMKHSGLFLYPVKATFYNFGLVFRNHSIFTGYLNTIFVVVVGTTLNVLLSLIGAYVLSRKGPMLVKFFTMMIVFTMYFQGGTIPTYLVVEGLGLINTRWSLILPGAISTFNMIVMRTAMSQVPDSLPESAMIDGASHTQILFRIMTPLCKATVAVIVLYYAVAHWNSWFPAFLYLRDKSKYPLQLVLRQILFEEETNSMAAESLALSSEAVKYATIVVATVPILLIYPFLQKYFVKGVMVGAVKG
ncbi:MAG: carbohydrate ABC transporter permease [Spirochaetales bacterium]|nr:carbohydrate ABC transporter permease [Spirochaetales bacterium]